MVVSCILYTTTRFCTIHNISFFLVLLSCAGFTNYISKCMYTLLGVMFSVIMGSTFRGCFCHYKPTIKSNLNSFYKCIRKHVISPHVIVFILWLKYRWRPIPQYIQTKEDIACIYIYIWRGLVQKHFLVWKLLSEPMTYIRIHAWFGQNELATSMEICLN